METLLMRSAAATMARLALLVLVLLALDGGRDSRGAVSLTGRVGASTAPTAKPSLPPSSSDPTLTAFEYDAGTALITLTFDAVVQSKTFDITKVALQSALSYSSSSVTRYALNSTFNTVSLQGNSTTIYLYMTGDQRSEILWDKAFGTTIDDTYITMEYQAVRSKANHASQAISSSSAFKCTSFYADSYAPFMESFSIDMNTQLLSITYSEPVDTSSFRLSGLQLQVVAGIVTGADTDRVELVDTGFVVSSSSSFDRTIVASLGITNYRAITKFGREELFMKQADSVYLSALRSNVNDTNGNALNFVLSSETNAILVTDFVEDTTAPTLTSFSLDNNYGILNLYFSESIDIRYLNSSKVVLTNKMSSSLSPTYYRLTSIDYPLLADLEEVPVNYHVQIYFTESQFNLMSSDSSYGSASTTFLVLDAGVVQDTASSQNEYAALDFGYSDALAVTEILPDTTNPTLETFALDMNAKLMNLTFSKLIKASSLSVSSMTLLSDSTLGTATEKVVMSSSYLSVKEYRQTTDKVLVLELSAALFNLLKEQSSLANSQATSYVAVTAAFVTDNSGNAIIAVATSEASAATTYLPDRTSPSLESYTFSLNSGRVVFTFSEPVDAAQIYFPALTFSSDSRSTSATEMVSGDAACTVISSSETTLTAQLSSAVLNSMKKTTVCSTASRCYLSLASAFITDTATYGSSGAAVRNSVEAATLVKPSTFTADTTKPKVKYFDIDMYAKTISLFFDEPIQSSALDTSKVHLYGNHSFQNDTSHVQLSAYNFFDSVVDMNITITLTNYDYLRIKSDISLCSSSSDCYLAVESTLITDTSGNYINATLSSRMSPAAFGADTKPPELIAVAFNSATSNLTLYFDDILPANSLDLKMLYMSNAIGSKISLDRGIVSSTGHAARLFVSVSEVASALQSATIGTSQDDTKIYVSGKSAWYDVAENKAVKMASTSSAVRSGNTLLSFSLDIAAGTITLESAIKLTDNVNSFSATAISFASYDSSSVYALTGYTSYSVDLDFFLVVELTAADLAAIKSAFSLLKAQLYIKIARTAVVDMQGSVLSSALTLSPNNLRLSSEAPVLTSWSLDLGAGTVVLFFSKTVAVSEAAMDLLSIQSSRHSGNVSVDLADAVITTSTSASTSIELDINPAGVYPSPKDRIHASGVIARALSSTFLAVGSAFIRDTEATPSYMSEITSSNATAAAELIADLIPPELATYAVDFNTQTMTLEFTEAVNCSLVDVDRFVLGRDPDEETTDSKFRLVSSTVDTDASGGRTVVISISKADYRSIMLLAPQLCLTASTCHLSFKTGAVYDLSYEKVSNDELMYRYGAAPNSFTADSSSPTLTSFDFELESGLLSCRFSEVIKCQDFDVGQLTLQAAEYIGESSLLKYTLTNSTAAVSCPADYYDSFTITITKSAIITMKATASLAKSRTGTFLTLTRGAFSDAYGNANVAVIDGGGVQASNFTGDSTPPLLLSFTVSAAATVTLSFNEPVDTSSIKEWYISFQDAYLTYTKFFSLSVASYTSADSLNMIIQIALSTDYNRIIGDSDIFAFQTTTFLSFLTDMCSDASGNSIAAVATTQAIQIGPTIVNWGVDLNLDMIYLQFSEDVNENFTLAGIGIQSNASSNELGSVILTSSTHPDRSYSSSYAHYQQQLSRRDSNAIKLANLTRSIDLAFLTAPNALTSSVSDATIIAYLDTAEVRVSSALAASTFVADATAPSPLHFNLDLSTSVLDVVFDEPIDVSTVSLSGFTLLSYYGSFAQLSAEGAAVSLRNYTYLSINVSRADINSIKLSVAADGVLEYLLLEAGSVRDYYGNAVRSYDEYGPVRIGTFIADTAPPQLQSVEYDAGQGLFTITFDELVDMDSVAIDKWRLLNISDTSLDTNSNIEDNVLFKFTNYSFVEYGESYSTLEVSLALYGTDYYRLQDIVKITSNSSSTFLFAAAVSDIFGNRAAAGTYRMSITSDVTPPSLLAMDFFSGSSSAYSVTMYFSENIVYSSFNVSSFTFVEKKSDNRTNNRRLVLDGSDIAVVGSSAYALANLTHSLKFTVAKTIFSQTSIGAAAATTYIYASVASSAPVDRYGNRLKKTSAAAAVRAGPALLKYALDMNRGRLTVVFSRTVNLFGHFNASSIGFYSPTSRQQMFISSGINPGGAQDLASRFVSNANDSVASMLLSPRDSSSLKLLDVSRSSAYLIVRADGMVFDTDNQRLIPIDKSDALLPSKFIADRTAPRLLNVTIDMSLNRIYFYFSEPIRQSSMVFTKFIIQSNVSSRANSYQLTGGSVTIALDTAILALANADSGALKLQDGICKNETNTFLSFAYQACADMAGNFLRSVPSTSALNFSRFVPDTLGPTLDSFAADMELGRLYLTFSEPVLATSINYAAYSLQNRFFSKDGSNYTLTGGNVTSPDGSSVTLQLTDSDRDRLRYEVNMFRTKYSAYLVISTEAATDVLGNAVFPVLDGAALPCSVLTTDDTRPYVLKVSMSVDNSYIDVYLSEWIVVDLVDISAFTIQSEASAVEGTSSFSLTKGLSRRAFYAHPYSKVLRIEIADHDMNILKQLPSLARSRLNTYFSFSLEFAEDVYGNSLIPIPSSAALQVGEIITDSVTPQVLTYSLDMNENSISIQFDEAVDGDTLDLSQLYVQTSNVRRNGNFTTLAGSSIIVLDRETSTVVDITFSAAVSRYMKYSSIGKTYDLSKVTWLEKFVADFSGLYIKARYDAAVYGYSAMAPTAFAADTTGPTLLSWFFDRDQPSFLLEFDEPVRTVNASQIVVHRHILGDLASSTSLQPGGANVSVVYGDYNSKVYITVSDACIEFSVTAAGASVCSLRLLEALASSADQELYLSLGDGSFADFSLAENKVNPVLASSPKKEGTPDCEECPSGFFQSVACSSTDDKQCAACSSCPVGTFVGTACTSDFDTICQRCSDCAYGQFIATACGTSIDTACSSCTVCASNEYQLAECANGIDTQCSSCYTCSFADSSAADQCFIKKYYTWARANCCKDTTGALVACSEKDLKDLYYSAVSGMHDSAVSM